MVSALAAATATRDSRRSRDTEWRDRWRLEKERRLDALADAVVTVGEAAIRSRGITGEAPGFSVAKMKLRRAVLDALNPWIDLEAVYELERRAPRDIDDSLIDEALNAIANNVEEVGDQAFKTRRENRRELRGRL